MKQEATKMGQVSIFASIPSLHGSKLFGRYTMVKIDRQQSSTTTKPNNSLTRTIESV